MMLFHNAFLRADKKPLAAMKAASGTKAFTANALYV